MYECFRKIKRHIRIFSNEVRRWIVNSLIGNSLEVEIIKTPLYTTVEVIDIRRRLNYGKWKIDSTSTKGIKISR